MANDTLIEILQNDFNELLTHLDNKDLESSLYLPLIKTFQSHNITIEDWNALVYAGKITSSDNQALINFTKSLNEYIINVRPQISSEIDSKVSVETEDRKAAINTVNTRLTNEIKNVNIKIAGTEADIETLKNKKNYWGDIKGNIDNQQDLSNHIKNSLLPYEKLESKIDDLDSSTSYTEDKYPNANAVNRRLSSKADKSTVDEALEATNGAIDRVKDDVDTVTDDLDTFKASTINTLTKKADLDENGHVPASQLPSFVDDVLEFASIVMFPNPGETGKIYVDSLTNKSYRWSGSQYVEISASLALGETSSTAFPGNRGKEVEELASQNAADIAQIQSDSIKDVTLNDTSIVDTSGIANIKAITTNAKQLHNVEIGSGLILENNILKTTDTGAKLIEVGSGQATYFNKLFPQLTKSKATEIYDTYTSGTPVIMRWTVMGSIPVEATIIGSDYVAGKKSFNVVIHDIYSVEYSYTDSTGTIADMEVKELGGSSGTTTRLTGATQTLTMAANVYYICSTALTSLTIDNFTKEGVGNPLWEIKFKTGASFTGSFPNVLNWVNGTPSFAAEEKYSIYIEESIEADKYDAYLIEG